MESFIKRALSQPGQHRTIEQSSNRIEVSNRAIEASKVSLGHRRRAAHGAAGRLTERASQKGMHRCWAAQGAAGRQIEPT